MQNTVTITKNENTCINSIQTSPYVQGFTL